MRAEPLDPIALSSSARLSLCLSFSLVSSDTPWRKSTPFDFSLHSIPPHCTRPSRRAHSREHSPSPNLSFCRPFYRKGREATRVYILHSRILTVLVFPPSLPASLSLSLSVLCLNLQGDRRFSVYFPLIHSTFDLFRLSRTALRVGRFDYHTMDRRPIVESLMGLDL